MNIEWLTAKTKQKWTKKKKKKKTVLLHLNIGETYTVYLTQPKKLNLTNLNVKHHTCKIFKWKIIKIHRQSLGQNILPLRETSTVTDSKNVYSF